MPKHLFSTGALRRSHKITRRFLKAAVPIARFLAKAPRLTNRERFLIVDQATMLLEDFYVHLPLKREMYAVDPLRRLKLLRQRIPRLANDVLFHNEMLDIFTSVRDLHTNYVLPAPFRTSVAWLPFKVEACEGGEDRECEYIVAKVAGWFRHRTFRKGVKILYWNGVPIARAVEIVGAQSAGGNPAAQLAQGLIQLTARTLMNVPLPEEEWVSVRYRDRRGRERVHRFDWLVTNLEKCGGKPRTFAAERIREINKFLFAPQVIDTCRKIERKPNPLSSVKGAQTTMPDFFRPAILKTRGGKKIGYVRIFSFEVPRIDDFVSEFARLVEKLPPDGLVIDVRDNGGGHTAAAERLLQFISPRQPIEPQHLYFINTPLTLKLCQIQKSNRAFGPRGLLPWIASMQRSLESGALYSAGFPYTDPHLCNSIGRFLYRGPVIVIINANSYSATEFFAAGFQDHGGKVLGTDRSSGGGGGNVRSHLQLRSYFRGARQSPFKLLPKEADLRVAFRRAMRVGTQFGNEIEDFGVTPDFFHAITRNDVLNKNEDLIDRAATLLSGA